MEIFMGPLFMIAGIMDMQASFWLTKREAQIIPFPTKRRRRRSGQRQASRDAINAAIDKA